MLHVALALFNAHTLLGLCRPSIHITLYQDFIGFLKSGVIYLYGYVFVTFIGFRAATLPIVYNDIAIVINNEAPDSGGVTYTCSTTIQETCNAVRDKNVS